LEKLNKIERYKAELSPSALRFKLQDIDYSKVDEQMRFYLKNYGIYNIKLRPEVWTLRIRVDSGEIETQKLLSISDIVKEYGLSIIITARAQIELHNISADDIYSVYKRVLDSGMTTHQTFTDNFRAIVTDPFDALSSDSYIECKGIIEQIDSLILDKEEWMGTIPRKFNTALIGREYPIFNPWSNDALFALAKKDKRVGFNLYLGGKNSEVAKSADIFIDKENAPKLFIAVAKTFKEYGLRGSRAKTRLYHLIERDGIDKVREYIEEFYGNNLEAQGKLLLKNSTDTIKGVEYLSFKGHYGEFDSDTLIDIANEAKNGGYVVRLSPTQEIFLIKPKEDNITQIDSSSIIACAGARYCPLSLWDIKNDIDSFPIDRMKSLKVSFGVSGCLKGCGRHYHSDIGVIGLRTNLYAPTERAGRVYLGATQVPNPTPARMLYYSVPLRKLNDLIETILDDFQNCPYSKFEEFSRNVLNRYDIEFLQLWYIVRGLYSLDESIFDNFYQAKRDLILREFNNLDNFPKGESIEESIRQLSHRLWDLKE